jgi:glutamate 5-kinase
VDVEGTFDVESVVDVVSEGRRIARAVSELSSADLARVKGLHTPEARGVLGIAGAVNVTTKGKVLLLDGK